MPARKKTSRKKASRTTARAATRTVKKRTTRTASSTRRKAQPAAAPKSVTTAIREPYTKSQLVGALADNTGVAKKDVVAVLDELGSVIERHVKKRAVGYFTLPGLMKIRTVRKPATKARKGRNPFTGEDIMIKAKPARTVVKVTPLKALKEMVD